LLIIGQYPGHWNVLNQQKCGNAQNGDLKNIFDGKMTFPVSRLLILGQNQHHLNAPIQPKSGNADHLFTFGT
jgi:hypothetical protein